MASPAPAPTSPARPTLRPRTPHAARVRAWPLPPARRSARRRASSLSHAEPQTPPVRSSLSLPFHPAAQRMPEVTGEFAGILIQPRPAAIPAWPCLLTTQPHPPGTPSPHRSAAPQTLAPAAALPHRRRGSAPQRTRPSATSRAARTPAPAPPRRPVHLRAA